MDLTKDFELEDDLISDLGAVFIGVECLIFNKVYQYQFAVFLV